ncbi:MAG: exo-alpha-sialidase [bacterium]|nr:exo-alpha-sialidase [bacterium]
MAMEWRLMVAGLALVAMMGWHWNVAAQTPQAEGVSRALRLEPSENNPRNSEGDFIQLKDGRILFVYTHFTGGGGDHDKAFLAGRYSSDGGKTWTTEDVVVLPNEGGMNIMSVSLLRLQSGRIALFYLRKNATDDCRPLMRISTDEAQTWSEPTLCLDEPVGYYVVNNDRIIQLKSGRLVIPAARHALLGGPFSGNGKVVCVLSDDEGVTWRLSKTTQEPPAGMKSTFQEPGVVELKDGRIMMLHRTGGGCQYRSWSDDGGETWSKAEPTDIMSPVSPASFEVIPSTGDLLLVWNDHKDIAPELRGKRTPLTVAVSRDEGLTWDHIKNIETDPNGWYCYTAIEFVGDAVLLGHCAGDRRKGGLNVTQITRFEVDWLYR